jgi:hypothetical protein
MAEAEDVGTASAFCFGIHKKGRHDGRPIIYNNVKGENGKLLDCYTKVA